MDERAVRSIATASSAVLALPVASRYAPRTAALRSIRSCNGHTPPFLRVFRDERHRLAQLLRCRCGEIENGNVAIGHRQKGAPRKTRSLDPAPPSRRAAASPDRPIAVRSSTPGIDFVPGPHCRGHTAGTTSVARNSTGPSTIFALNGKRPPSFRNNNAGSESEITATIQSELSVTTGCRRSTPPQPRPSRSTPRSGSGGSPATPMASRETGMDE